MPKHALAVDLGGTKISAAVVDSTGRILTLETVPVDLSSASAPVLQIRDLAFKLATRKSPKQAFIGAAVAVPGLVRPNGTVWAPNLPGWTRMPLAARLLRSLAIPVVVESDRNAAVLGETWKGAAKGKSDAIVLMIGTGIGAGILSGGRILRGAHELSGCAGWLTVSGDLNEFSSQVGELESMAAGPAIPRRAQALLRNGARSSLTALDLGSITGHEVATAARQGDQLALSIFNEVGVHLGRAIANMVSLIDPQVVVIGGGMAATSDLFLDALKRTMLQFAQPISGQQVKIAISRLGGSANLLGCARLAFEY